MTAETPSGGEEGQLEVQSRSRAEWVELIRTMLPQPVTLGDQGELLGGDPVVVIVEIKETEIAILEPRWAWEQTHAPTRRTVPFANLPVHTPPTRVAELIVGAWARRLARYKWCPECRRIVEPERTLSSGGGICHGCAERVMGVVF